MIDVPKLPWPTHPDGRPMKMGEMTQEQRRGQFAAAVATVKREFENPSYRQAMIDAGRGRLLR